MRDLRPKSSNRTALVVLLCGGTVAAVLLCAGVGVIAYSLWPTLGVRPPENDRVKQTRAKWSKIKTGKKRQEIEEILGGPGENISLDAANALLKRTGQMRGDPNRALGPDIANRPGATYTVWRFEQDHILIAFIPSKYGDLATFGDLCIDMGSDYLEGGLMYSTPGGVELGRKELEDELIHYNDPRWIKGQARKLIVGAWRDNLKREIEFNADGTMSKLFSPGRPERWSGTYSFLDDEHIQYDIQLQGWPPDRTVFRVFANEHELFLLQRAHEPFFGGRGPDGRYYKFRPENVMRRLEMP